MTENSETPPPPALLYAYTQMYLSRLESLLGQRHTQWILGTIRLDSDTPSIHLWRVERVVDIRLSRDLVDQDGAFQLPRALWQLAHECVHVLEPTLRGTARVVEEGIATAFQESMIPLAGNDAGSKYEAARQLVERYWDPLIGTVRSLRERGVLLSTMDYGVLRPLLPPEIPDEALAELTKHFETWYPEISDSWQPKTPHRGFGGRCATATAVGDANSSGAAYRCMDGKFTLARNSRLLT